MSTMQDAAAWTAIAIQAANEKHLTGAEKELLDYNAEQAQIAREFNANEARLAREFNANEALLNRQFQSAEAALARQWQEDFYNNYESPAARMRQYQDAGLNPALMYQSAPGGNVPSASSPSGSAASGSAASGSAASGSALNRQSALAQMFLQLAQLDAHIENVNADTAQKLASAEQTKVSTEFDSKSMQNRLSLFEKQLREYDTRDRLNISSIRLNDVSCDKIITETNKAVVEMATEKLKQSNINITNEKLAQEILYIQVEKGLKILESELRGKQITAQELDNVRQAWENKFKDEVGFSPDQPIWNALTSFLGETAIRTSDVIENIVSWFNKRK